MKRFLTLMLFLVCRIGNANAATPGLVNRTGTRVYLEVTDYSATEYIVSGGQYYMRRVDPSTYEPIQSDYTYPGLAWSGVSSALSYDYYIAEWEWISDSVMWGMDSDGDCYSDMMEAIYGSDALDADSVPDSRLGARSVMKHCVLTAISSAIPDSGSCGGGGNGGGSGGNDGNGLDNGGNTGGNTGNGGDGPGNESEQDDLYPNKYHYVFSLKSIVDENGDVIPFSEYYQSLIDADIIGFGLYGPSDIAMKAHMYPMYMMEVAAHLRTEELRREKENWNWSKEMGDSVKFYSEEEMAKLDAEIAAMERAVVEQEAANYKLNEIGSAMNTINDNLGSGGSISTQVQNSSKETNSNLLQIGSGIGTLNQKASTIIGKLTSINTGVDNIGDNLQATKEATVMNIIGIKSTIAENLGEDSLLDSHLEELKISTDNMSRHMGLKLDGVFTQMQGHTDEIAYELQALGVMADSQREMLETYFKEMTKQREEHNEKLLRSEKAIHEEMQDVEQAIENGDSAIVNAIGRLENQTITNTDRIVGTLADHDVNVTVDVNADGITGRLDAIIGGLGEIADNTASGGIGEGVDLSGVEGKLATISGQIDKGLDLLRNGLDGTYTDYEGFGDWKKPEATELMQFDLDLTDAKSQMKAAVERLGVDFDSLNTYSASPFSTQIKIPVGGTLNNLRWYNYTFSMDTFPAEVQSGIDRFRQVFLTISKAVMSLLFGRKVWAMLWSL